MVPLSKKRPEETPNTTVLNQYTTIETSQNGSSTQRKRRNSQSLIATKIMRNVFSMSALMELGSMYSKAAQDVKDALVKLLSRMKTVI